MVARVEKQSPNFPYLACEIEFFSKKFSGKQSLKISHIFFFFFLNNQTLENTENYLYMRFSIETNGALMFLNLSISRENNLIICHLKPESMTHTH